MTAIAYRSGLVALIVPLVDETIQKLFSSELGRGSRFTFTLRLAAIKRKPRESIQAELSVV
jgi:hypothetical protein